MMMMMMMLESGIKMSTRVIITSTRCRQRCRNLQKRTIASYKSRRVRGEGEETGGGRLRLNLLFNSIQIKWSSKLIFHLAPYLCIVRSFCQCTQISILILNSPSRSRSRSHFPNLIPRNGTTDVNCYQSQKVKQSMRRLAVA